jgi:hypothetical protein
VETLGLYLTFLTNTGTVVGRLYRRGNQSPFTALDERGKACSLEYLAETVSYYKDLVQIQRQPFPWSFLVEKQQRKA